MANRRFAPAARKRVMSWDGANVDVSDLVVGTAQFITILTEAILEQFPTPTLVRSRGRLTVLTDPSSALGGFGFVTMGMIVVIAAAAASGGVPNPATASGSDWLWWDSGFVGASATDVIGEEITVDWVQVDSKAMRKIGLNQLLVLVMDLQTCEGTMVANVCGSIRCLLKAP